MLSKLLCCFYCKKKFSNHVVEGSTDSILGNLIKNFIETHETNCKDNDDLQVVGISCYSPYKQGLNLFDRI